MEFIIRLSVLGLVLGASTSTSGRDAQPERNINYLSSHVTPPRRPEFRLPPSSTNRPDSTWLPTPPGWLWGTWYFHGSNQATYSVYFRDIQWTLSPILVVNNSVPSLVMHDVVTYYLQSDPRPESPTLHMSYGVDYPVVYPSLLPPTTSNNDGEYEYVPDCYHSRPNPPLDFANNTWTVIAWGYDSVGAAYVALHETAARGQSSASLDFVSRSRLGIAPETMRLLKGGIESLGSDELLDLLANVTTLLQDGARDDSPWPACNASCMANEYSVTVIPHDE